MADSEETDGTGESDEVVCVRAGERHVADPTPGKTREEALHRGGLWSGVVRTEPGVASGWHHHGDHVSSVYVIEGHVRLEFGPAGTRSVEAGPGDFVLIPAHLVHREVNPGPGGSFEVITRHGSGPLTVNVDGPAPAG